MSSILKKYEISPSELRKILKEMRITLPEMGYWQKIQYDQFLPKELTFRGHPVLNAREVFKYLQHRCWTQQYELQ